MPFNSFDNYPLSWKPDRNLLQRPVFQSLARQLELDIQSGYLPSGTKLPPQRELADYLDLNFTTVTRAYKICELKGLIHGVTGRGTFVSQYAARPATISTQGNPNHAMIELGFVASFEQCNAMLKDTIADVTKKSYLEQLLNYEHPTGMPHHKKAALDWMAQFGVTSDPDHTAIVSGTQNGLALALIALFAPGDRIAVDHYIYPNFIELAQMYHISLLSIPGDEHGMLPDALEAQCRQVEIKGIFLMPSCNNPTTVVMSETRKQAIASVINRYSLTLIEDDIHSFLTAGIVADYKGPLFRYLNTPYVYICGTSKSLCSGLRIAYLVFSDNTRDKLYKAIFNTNVKTSSLDAEIISELITNGTAARIVLKKQRLAMAANQLFYEIFHNTESEPTSVLSSTQYPMGHPASFYRWLPIHSSLNGIEAEHILHNAGINIYHSDRFLCRQPDTQKYLRVSLASIPTEAELSHGLHLLHDVLTQNGML